MSALNNTITGNNNTASGLNALYFNTTGSNNTALGSQAGVPAIGMHGYSNTGSNNTYLGYNSGSSVSTEIDNATAIGANAVVSASNSLVLGGINGVNGATFPVNVGIGTSTPLYMLDVEGGQINASGGLCIGGVCKTSWPTGSGGGSVGNGTVTTVAVGAGLTASPSPIVTSGTISVATGGITSALIASGTIVDANINASAAISPTKINWTAATLGANSFGATQSINGGFLAMPNTAATSGTATAGVITLGGIGFLHNYGNYNTFVGQYSGNFKLGGGAANTAVGYQALTSLSTGYNDTAIGTYALENNLGGEDNTAMGSGALQENLSDENTAVGAHTLDSNTVGQDNTATGSGALGQNISGSNNTALGFGSGAINLAQANVTGSYNTFIGSEAGAANSTQLNNATAIGANAVVAASNALVLGSIKGVNGATSNVNVGIGTSAPAYALDVESGQINASGGLCIAGTCQTSWPAGGFAGPAGPTGPAGPVGPAGAPGAPGVNGLNAYTAATAAFTQPAAGATVGVSVGNTAWMAPGQTVFVATGGYYTVSSITDATDAVLTNLGYPANAAPASQISSAEAVSPGGVQGPAGTGGGGTGTGPYTVTTAAFTQPAAEATVSLSVGSTAWMATGQVVFVATGGYYTVRSITDATDVVLTNLGYPGNTAPAAQVASGEAVSPGGLEGPAGATGITGVTAATGLTGGGTIGTISLGVDESVVAFQSDLTAGVNTAEGFATNAATTAQTNAVATAEGYSNSKFLPLAGGTLTGNLSAVTTNLSGSLYLPATSSLTVGVIWLGSEPFLQNTANNTLVGSNAGNFTMTGGGNTAVGFGAFGSNSTGIGNTVSGMSALGENTTGSANTATGYSALFFNTSGSGNTANGSEALWHNTVGADNTANGEGALAYNKTGNSNTADGDMALYSNNSGGYNTALGWQAGYTMNGNTPNVTGSNNTFLGSNSGPGIYSEVDNATAIGANAVVSASNALVLGSIIGLNGATSSVNVGIGTAMPGQALDVVGNINASGCFMVGGTGFQGTCSSDARLKKNIQYFPQVLDKLVQLQPASWYWRAEEFPQYHFGPGRNVGLVAQEVEKVFPEMVSTDDRGYKQVNYSQLPYLMLQAIRELKTENDDLRDQLKAQEERLHRLEEIVLRQGQ